LLLVHEGHNASEEALDKIQDIGDGLDDKSLGGKEVTVEHHLPLNAALWREEG
jgi:hypothetical protein